MTAHCITAYKESQNLIHDYLDKASDLTTKYSLTQRQIRQAVYLNLPNVLSMEPNLIDRLDIKHLAKPLPNQKDKYITGLKEWLQQFIFVPSDETIRFINRIQPKKDAEVVRSARLLMLDERTNAILHDGEVGVAVAERPQFDTMQIFVTTNAIISSNGFMEPQEYPNLASVYWRVFATDRLDLLTYSFLDLPQDVQTYLQTKFGKAKSIKAKNLLPKKVVEAILKDVQDRCVFTMYRNTYTAYIK